MLQSLMAHLYLVGAGQGFFLLGFILFSNKIRNRMTAALLAVLVFLFTYNLVYYFLAYSGAIVHVPHLFGSNNTLILLYGPLFYFILKSLTEKETLTKRSVLHLIPWLAFIISFIPMYLFPADAKVAFYQRDMAQGGFYRPNPLFITLNLALVTHLGIYLFLSVKLIGKYLRHRILQPILYAFIAFTGLAVVYHFMHFSGIGYFSLVCYLVKLLMAGIIYSIAYTLFLNGGTWEIPVSRKKYETSAIDTASAEIIAGKIQLMLEQKTLFLDPDFNLSELANRLDMPVHYLSRAVNEHLKCSFTDLINGYRIEYAKELLKATDDKIIAIAYASGFNNKVTFTNAFKRKTGQTPSAYRDAKSEDLIS